MYLHVTQSDLQSCAALANNSQLLAIRIIEAHSRVDSKSPVGPGDVVPLETEIKHGVVSVDLVERHLTAQLRFEVTARHEGNRTKVVSLQSRWMLDYAIHPDLPAEQLTAAAAKAFCRSSATMNAWPFWREYALSSLSRAGLPFFTLPLLTLRATDPKGTVTARKQTPLVVPGRRRKSITA